jgi:predicted negative regulator of RcsB-dependent stress response
MEMDHFTKEQVEVIKKIFKDQVNDMFTKIVAGNIVAVLLGAIAIGGAWWRLGNVEQQLAAASATHITKEQSDKNDEALQRQIDGVGTRLERIEDKIDTLIQRI